MYRKSIHMSLVKRIHLLLVHQLLEKLRNSLASVIFRSAFGFALARSIFPHSFDCLVCISSLYLYFFALVHFSPSNLLSKSDCFGSSIFYFSSFLWIIILINMIFSLFYPDQTQIEVKSIRIKIVVLKVYVVTF